jgi:hypothetical protein
MPSLDPAAHRAKLLKQLDAIGQQVQARSDTARDELASREIIAVRPAANTQLTADQLDDSRADARLVGVVAETGTVLLDVANSDLDYLRKKLDAFADDAKVEVKTHKDGSTTTHRDKERAVAPVDTIGLAALDDVAGAHLRAEALVPDRAYWFEVACRGGYRRPLSDTEGSRAQIARQLHRVGALQKLDEFVGPEQVYFFVRLTRAQLDAPPPTASTRSTWRRSRSAISSCSKTSPRRTSRPSLLPSRTRTRHRLSFSTRASRASTRC